MYGEIDKYSERSAMTSFLSPQGEKELDRSWQKLYQGQPKP